MTNFTQAQLRGLMHAAQLGATWTIEILAYGLF